MELDVLTVFIMHLRITSGKIILFSSNIITVSTISNSLYSMFRELVLLVLMVVCKMPWKAASRPLHFQIRLSRDYSAIFLIARAFPSLEIFKWWRCSFGHSRSYGSRAQLHSLKLIQTKCNASSSSLQFVFTLKILNQLFYWYLRNSHLIFLVLRKCLSSEQRLQHIIYGLSQC